MFSTYRYETYDGQEGRTRTGTFTGITLPAARWALYIMCIALYETENDHYILSRVFF